MPRATVIIPAYNAERYLERTLASLLGQTVPDWEAIVIDDGSKDATAAIVQKHVPLWGGRLRYLYQNNAGPSAARNTGLRQAQGDIICLLDADDLWLPQRLERTLEVFETNAGVGLCHANVLRINHEGKPLDRPEGPEPRDRFGAVAQALYTRRLHILAPTVAFRRACVAQIGYFDEAMRACEDRDYWFRIARQWKTAHVNEEWAHYRIHATSASASQQKMFDGQRQFFEKHRQSVPAHIYRQAMAGAYREYGDHCFGYGHVKQSLPWYWGSVVRHPSNWRNAYMLARALTEPIFGGSGHRAARGT
jgi:glycosyltransferase involved in cell wall biosynthesis